jgi:hypothetical protein
MLMESPVRARSLLGGCGGQARFGSFIVGAVLHSLLLFYVTFYRHAQHRTAPHRTAPPTHARYTARARSLAVKFNTPACGQAGAHARRQVGTQARSTARRHAGTQAGGRARRRAGRHAGGRAGTQAGGQARRRAGRHAGGRAGTQAGVDSSLTSQPDTPPPPCVAAAWTST